MQYFMNGKRVLFAVAGFAAFVVIAYFVVTQNATAFDTAICESVYRLRAGGLTIFFTVVTYFGNWQTVTTLCCLFLLLPTARLRFGVPVSAAAILASLLQKALKTSFHRPRPELALHLINQGGYSFPSGHSFTVLIFYGLLIWLCRQHMKNKTAANAVTILLSSLIALIGFSRVYLGVHYPTDVLGGWSLGFCVLMLLISCVDFFQNRRDPQI